MMDVAPTISGALLLGLFGSVHCLAMCGGLAGAFRQLGDRPTQGRLFVQQMAYGLGRVTSYAVAGAVAGALGHAIAGAAGPAV